MVHLFPSTVIYIGSRCWNKPGNVFTIWSYKCSIYFSSRDAPISFKKVFANNDHKCHTIATFMCFRVKTD